MLRSGRYRRRNSAAHQLKEAKGKKRNSTYEKLSEADNQGVSDEASATKPSQENRTDSLSPDLDMEDLSGAMSSLKFVPVSVKFGRGRGRGGFSKT